MASIGQADRPRRRPAEGDRPRAIRRGVRGAGCRACRAGAKHDRRRHDHRLRPRWRRRRCRACSRSSLRTTRRSCRIEGRAQQMVRCAVAAGQHPVQRPARRGGRGRDAGAGATQLPSRVRVQYRRDEPVTSMDAVLGQAYTPKNFRNGERPAGFSIAAIPTRRSTAAAAQGRCHLHHADGASQSDGAARDDRAVGRQSS